MILNFLKTEMKKRFPLFNKKITWMFETSNWKIFTRCAIDTVQEIKQMQSANSLIDHELDRQLR